MIFTKDQVIFINRKISIKPLSEDQIFKRKQRLKRDDFEIKQKESIETMISFITNQLKK